MPEFIPQSVRNAVRDIRTAVETTKFLHKRPHAGKLALHTPAGWLAIRRFTGLKSTAIDRLDRSGAASSDLLIPASRARPEGIQYRCPKCSILMSGRGIAWEARFEPSAAAFLAWTLVPSAAAELRLRHGGLTFHLVTCPAKIPLG